MKTSKPTNAISLTLQSNNGILKVSLISNIKKRLSQLLNRLK
ncbi:hypothetical protein BN1318_470013 [Staphylococcus capitis]|nr:hypothetical protein BN1318_470013 [Staphylococcus capitis]